MTLVTVAGSPALDSGQLRTRCWRVMLFAIRSPLANLWWDVLQRGIGVRGRWTVSIRWVVGVDRQRNHCVRIIAWKDVPRLGCRERGAQDQAEQATGVDALGRLF